MSIENPNSLGQALRRFSKVGWKTPMKNPSHGKFPIMENEQFWGSTL